jgi:transcriptional regulator with XRE-family HTH domain
MDIVLVGQRLREARRKLNLSQEEMASALGMSRATISALEGGRCTELGFTKLSALLEMVGLEFTVVDHRKRPTIDDLREEQHR